MILEQDPKIDIINIRDFTISIPNFINRKKLQNLINNYKIFDLEIIKGKPLTKSMFLGCNHIHTNINLDLLYTDKDKSRYIFDTEYQGERVYSFCEKNGEVCCRSNKYISGYETFFKDGTRYFHPRISKVKTPEFPIKALVFPDNYGDRYYVYSEKIPYLESYNSNVTLLFEVEQEKLRLFSIDYNDWIL